jgi:hypothetical protein
MSFRCKEDRQWAKDFVQNFVPTGQLDKGSEFRADFEEVFERLR